MFPGQGAQRAGLGTPWRRHPAWSVVERAESVLERPLDALLLDPGADLARTEDAQLAVLLASLMAWESISATIDAPVAFAGHSLGQVTALIAAGVLDLDDGLALAARRAAVTQAAADEHPGAMAALLGATLDQAEEACGAAVGSCWLANDNAPGQVVLAGTPAGVAAAVAKARELGVSRAVRLDVGGAFHTPLMAPAAAALAPMADEIPLSRPVTPVVSNGDARPYTDAEGWRSRLVDHLVTPVRWRQSVETVVGLGATELVEVGPGRILVGLARRIAPHVPVRTADAPLQEVSTCP